MSFKKHTKERAERPFSTKSLGYAENAPKPSRQWPRLRTQLQQVKRFPHVNYKIVMLRSEHQGVDIPRLNENLSFDDIGREQE